MWSVVAKRFICYTWMSMDAASATTRVQVCVCGYKYIMTNTNTKHTTRCIWLITAALLHNAWWPYKMDSAVSRYTGEIAIMAIYSLLLLILLELILTQWLQLLCQNTISKEHVSLVSVLYILSTVGHFSICNYFNSMPIQL